MVVFSMGAKCNMVFCEVILIDVVFFVFFWSMLCFLVVCYLCVYLSMLFSFNYLCYVSVFSISLYHFFFSYC